eukprot:gene134-210_t
MRDSSEFSSNANDCYWTLIFHNLDIRTRAYCKAIRLDLADIFWSDSANIDDSKRASNIAARLTEYDKQTLNVKQPRCKFDASCVYENLIPLFLNRRERSVVEIFNDYDLALLQHICDSAGVSLRDLFDAHLVTLSVDVMEVSRGRIVLQFDNFLIQPVSAFENSSKTIPDNRFLNMTFNNFFSSNVVWVSNAIERCCYTINMLIKNGSFPSKTMDEEVEMGILREDLMVSNFKIHLLSASIKNAATDCRLYLQRQGVITDWKNTYLGEHLLNTFNTDFPISDFERSQQKTSKKESFTREECDPFLDETYFTTKSFSSSDVISEDVGLLLSLYEEYYTNLNNAKEYLFNVVEMYKRVTIPYSVPNNLTIDRTSHQSERPFLSNRHVPLQKAYLANQIHHIIVPTFEELLHFPNDADANAALQRIFSRDAKQNSSDKAGSYTTPEITEWRRQCEDRLRDMFRRYESIHELIRDERNASDVSLVVNAFRNIASNWTREIAKDTGSVSESFFDSRRSMAHDTAVTLSFWFGQLRDGEEIENILAKWRHNWGGGFFLPNCVRYVVCDNLLNETTLSTLGPQCTANLWCLMAFEMHLAVLSTVIKMISNVEICLRKDLEELRRKHSNYADNVRERHDVRTQVCRLVGMFAKRSSNIRDAKTFRSEAERHEFYKTLNEDHKKFVQDKFEKGVPKIILTYPDTANYGEDEILEHLKHRVPVYYGQLMTTAYHDTKFKEVFGRDTAQCKKKWDDLPKDMLYAITAPVTFKEPKHAEKTVYIMHTWGVNMEGDDTLDYKQLNKDGSFDEKAFTERYITLFKLILRSVICSIPQKKKVSLPVKVRCPLIGMGQYLKALSRKERFVAYNCFARAVNTVLYETLSIMNVTYPKGFEFVFCNLNDDYLVNFLNSVFKYTKVKMETLLKVETTTDLIQVIVNAWDSHSFIGNGGQEDLTIDGFIVANAGRKNNDFVNDSYLHNPFFTQSLEIKKTLNLLPDLYTYDYIYKSQSNLLCGIQVKKKNMKNIMVSNQFSVVESIKVELYGIVEGHNAYQVWRANHIARRMDINQQLQDDQYLLLWFLIATGKDTMTGIQDSGGQLWNATIGKNFYRDAQSLAVMHHEM